MASTLSAALPDLTVGEPATVYIQWLANATDPMTDMDGDGGSPFSPYDGGPGILLQASPALDFHIGIMCNRLTGYDIHITANGTPTTTTSELTNAGGSTITMSSALTKVAGTFASGATASPSLDLTGSTASATAVFATNGDLPLTSAAPNVWKLTGSLPSISTVSDGMVMAGTYTGTLTAMVSLK